MMGEGVVGWTAGGAIMGSMRRAVRVLESLTSSDAQMFICVPGFRSARGNFQVINQNKDRRVVVLI